MSKKTKSDRLRLAIGARMTEERHVREAWDLIQTLGEKILKV